MAIKTNFDQALFSSAIQTRVAQTENLPRIFTPLSFFDFWGRRNIFGAGDSHKKSILSNGLHHLKLSETQLSLGLTNFHPKNTSPASQCRRIASKCIKSISTQNNWMFQNYHLIHCTFIQIDSTFLTVVLRSYTLKQRYNLKMNKTRCSFYVNAAHFITYVCMYNIYFIILYCI